MALKLPSPPVERPTGDEQQQAEDERQLGVWRDILYRLLTLVGTNTIAGQTINSGAVAENTITVKGCKADKQQTVLVTPPAAIEAGLVWCGYVSADDTVTVRQHNTTGAPINTADALWSARVFP